MQEIDPTEAQENLNDLGHLASAVGHHVINAFSAVVSNAEILRLKMAMNPPVDPSVLANMIITTAMDAASVARRLIDYTRPITNIGDEYVELDRLVADFVDRKRNEKIAGISWSVDAAPIPPIRGQAAQIRSMLDEVVINALEAADGRPIEIAISTSLDARGWVALEIRDSGHGMEPEVLERAVEPFFTTKSGHIGVGLSIANGIWRRHKGTLSLRSAPGEGTTLRLCVEPAIH
ncbi:sensor histidine kinase [Tundrisphaera lichenicola]|uniref:sensor histidine kinase n=1 Tax=Tundrisphaera lichenicola TaxID=2029860 RepID=UPI003EC0581A